MKGRVYILPLVLLLSFPLVSGCSENVKQPAVAGAFYPADAGVLRTTVDAYLAAAPGPAADHGRLITLIAPHAGYEYSGQVAAFSYRHLEERSVETVILIGPSHYASISGASVYAEGALATPLGIVKVNKRIARSLINEQAQVAFNPAAFEKEHSLEVQLPFLQRTLKNFTVVPILIGNPTREMFQHLSEKLTAVLRSDPKTIIIASTDLSHYHDYGTAVNMDKRSTDAVARMSLEDLEGLFISGGGEMCGSYPVLLAMMVARSMGATQGELYRYANSGDVTGDRGRVVGYAAMGLYKSALSEQNKKFLLDLAKRTIKDYIETGRTPDPKIADPRLLANGATFVTINRNRMLRGCIGNIEPLMPLYRSVIQNAVSACSRDPRFPPMKKDELRDIDVEVTVLSPLEPLADVKDLRVGTHGLFIVKGNASGILLPQVATEYGWDALTFLEEVSQKAGLPRDAWKGKDAKLYIYTAEIIKQSR